MAAAVNRKRRRVDEALAVKPGFGWEQGNDLTALLTGAAHGADDDDGSSSSDDSGDEDETTRGRRKLSKRARRSAKLAAEKVCFVGDDGFPSVRC
eukprot:m.300826 g.300826  ORF g.300826 m.300826 type:complete len:95 (-) comp19559_c0_seq12:3-287(-)